MSVPGFEAFLARIYTDAEARARFLADPEGEAARAGLASGERAALAAIDRVGLELASRSFAVKRARKAACASPRSWRRWLASYTVGLRERWTRSTRAR